MSSIARPFCSEIIQAGSARPNKTEGQGKLNQSVASKYPQADFTPTITDVTQEGECFVIVGGVHPPAKAKADFVPEVIDITEEGGLRGLGFKPFGDDYLFCTPTRRRAQRRCQGLIS